MNEKIKEIIQQIETDVSGKWISVSDAEKFAKLIVLECAMAINKNAGPFTTGPGYLLLEHFGVYEE